MSKVLFLYNNVDKPQLTIKLIENDAVSNVGFLSFDKTSLSDNLPFLEHLITALDEFLTRKDIVRNDVLFVVNAKDSIKLTTVLPNISDRRIKKVYETELAQKISDINNYDCMSVSSDAGNNKVFYEYLVDTKYRKFFEKVGTSLDFENVEVDYMNSYLFSEITPNIEEDTFAYIYEENKMDYLIVVVNGELCGYSSFENSENNCRLNVASIIDKHIYDLEKANIENLYSNRYIQCLEALYPIVNKYILGGKFNG